MAEPCTAIFSPHVDLDGGFAPLAALSTCAETQELPISVILSKTVESCRELVERERAFATGLAGLIEA